MLVRSMSLLDSIFGWFQSAPYQDPALGQLVHRWGAWHGQITVDGAEPVPLQIVGGKGSPPEHRLALAREFPGRYAALRPVIQQALWEHYAPYAESVAAGEIEEDASIPKLGGPDEVWPHTTLARVLIERMSGAETVELAYRVAWDEEHTLGARFQDWTLAELNGSVR